VEILKVDAATETDFHQPSWLPDGSGVLFAVHKMGGRPDSLVLYASGKRKELLRIDGQDIWFPLYSPTGHILYRRQAGNAGLWALPFSLARHEVTGEPFMVVPNGDVPSVSDDGTLVYVEGAASRMTQLEWLDRSGKVLARVGPPQEQWPFPEVSPDGRFVAVAATENEVGDIWIHDTERGTRTRLSTNSAQATPAAWSKDGARLVYAEGTNIPFHLMMKSADGGGDAKQLGTGWGASFSQDGRYLLYADFAKESDFNLFYLDLQGDGKAVPLVDAPGQELWPQLSPDGRYFAYVSDESGPKEVYIKRFPSAEGKWQVSTAGGFWPRWSRRGDHLYYMQELTLMQVDVATAPDLRLSAPRPLFTRKPLGWSLIFAWPPGFDISPQDDRFLIAHAAQERADQGGIMVVENWMGEFNRP
jgi:serine/threonine-protein kinase